MFRRSTSTMSESIRDDTPRKKSSLFSFGRTTRKSKNRASRNELQSKSAKEDKASEESRSEEQQPSRFVNSKESERDAVSMSTTKTSGDHRGKASDSRKQKQAVYTYFGTEAEEMLKVVERKMPEVESENHVLVKVLASTVSLYDCNIRRGIDFDLLDPVSLPVTPGQDAVGTIVAIGKKVENFKIGDSVAALVRTGGNSRFLNVQASSLVNVPKECEAGEAASLVSTYMTAYQVIRMVTREEFSLKEKSVLITGGIEPVGHALIGFCQRAGAQRIFVSAPEKRHKYLKASFGVQVLPEDPQKWPEQTNGTIDIAFDGTCNNGFDASLASLKDDGELVAYGMSSYLRKQEQGIFGAPLMAHWMKIKGSMLMSKTKSYDVWESFKRDKETFKSDLDILFCLLSKKLVKPNIVKRIGLDQVASAHASLDEHGSYGEIVCLPWKRVSGKTNSKE